MLVSWYLLRFSVIWVLLLIMRLVVVSMSREGEMCMEWFLF